MWETALAGGDVDKEVLLFAVTGVLTGWREVAVNQSAGSQQRLLGAHCAQTTPGADSCGDRLYRPSKMSWKTSGGDHARTQHSCDPRRQQNRPEQCTELRPKLAATQAQAQKITRTIEIVKV